MNLVKQVGRISDILENKNIDKNNIDILVLKEKLTLKFNENIDLSSQKTRILKKIETINERQSRFTELSNGISLKLTIHGYTGLAVGDMIRVFLPTIGGDDNDGIFNELFSGDYLISTLRHTFALPI